MGVRQSKRSVDITSTPKKTVESVEDGRLERLDEDKAPNGEMRTEEDTQVHEEQSEGNNQTTIENADDGKVEDGVEPVKEEKPEEKAKKEKKEKVKKKWSFRTMGFSKREKKVRDDSSKNGDVSKDEVVSENAEQKEGDGVNTALVETDSAEATKQEDSTQAPTAKVEEGSPCKQDDVTKPDEEKTEKESTNNAESAGSPNHTAPSEVTEEQVTVCPASPEVVVEAKQEASPPNELPPPLPASPPPKQFETETPVAQEPAQTPQSVETQAESAAKEVVSEVPAQEPVPAADQLQAQQTQEQEPASPVPETVNISAVPVSIETEQSSVSVEQKETTPQEPTVQAEAPPELQATVNIAAQNETVQQSCEEVDANVPSTTPTSVEVNTEVQAVPAEVASDVALANKDEPISDAAPVNEVIENESAASPLLSQPDSDASNITAKEGPKSNADQPTKDEAAEHVREPVEQGAGDASPEENTQKVEESTSDKQDAPPATVGEINEE